MSDALAKAVDQKLREIVLPLEENGCDIISPEAVANAVLRLLDPNNDSPEIVLYCSLMDLRQRCRAFLRRRHDPLEKARAYVDGASGDLFSGLLQDYYPARRGDDAEAVYVRRDQMSHSELTAVSTRMRKAGASLTRHADALDAFAACQQVA